MPSEHGSSEHEEGFLKINAGQHYNPYMAGDTAPNFEGDPRHAPPGGFLAMPPQLIEDIGTWCDNFPKALDDIDTWDQHRTWAQRWRPSAGPTVRPSSGSSP